jgi:hypothetical protein
MRPATSRLEDAPTREPMKASQSARKERADFLLLLRRFLLTNKDRPWADVYREMSTKLCTSNSERAMLRSRLPHMIALDVVAEGDELMRAESHQPLAKAPPPSNLYVCPHTGLLRRFSPDDARNRIQLSEWAMARRLGKRWYVLDLAPLPGESDAQMADVVLRSPVNQPSAVLSAKLARLYGRPGIFARDKRQIGKAEVERLRAGQQAAMTPLRPGRILPHLR